MIEMVDVSVYAHKTPAGNRNRVTAVATEGDKTVGFMNSTVPFRRTPDVMKTDPDTGQLFKPGYRQPPTIGGAYIHKDHQLQGIGTAMLEGMNGVWGEEVAHSSTISPNAVLWAQARGGKINYSDGEDVLEPEDATDPWHGHSESKLDKYRGKPGASLDYDALEKTVWANDVTVNPPVATYRVPGKPSSATQHLQSEQLRLPGI